MDIVFSGKVRPAIIACPAHDLPGRASHTGIHAPVFRSQTAHACWRPLPDLTFRHGELQPLSARMGAILALSKLKIQ
ncbi:MAG: hypothetical protein ABIY56_08020 [Dokdonella sp.]